MTWRRLNGCRRRSDSGVRWHVTLWLAVTYRPLLRPSLCVKLKAAKHKVAEMKKPSGPSVERLTEAPIIYCDTIPTVSLNSGIVDLTLAATLTEVPDGIERKRLVVVADLKMPLSTAISLRDLLDKIVLAAQPTPEASN